MSDTVLEAKFSDLAGEVLGADQADRLLAAVWALDEAPDVSDIAKLMVKAQMPA